MFSFNFHHHGVLLLAIGALIVSVASYDQDHIRESWRIFKEACNPKLRFSNEEVFKLLQKALEKWPANENVQLFIDARESISTPRCTPEYQGWLDKMRIEYNGSPMGSYFKHIIKGSRVLCSQTFKQRFQAEMAQIEQGKIDLVSKFGALLNETSNLDPYLRGRDDISTVSLVDAIKKYTGDQEDGKYASELEKIRDTKKTHQQVSEALAPLLTTCVELTQKFKGFFLTIRKIKWPSDLDPDIEQALWATKICLSLKFSYFEGNLSGIHHGIGPKNQRLVSRFTKLLNIPIDAWLKPESIKQKLDLLLNERERLSEEGLKRSELMGQLREEFGDACASYVRGMSNSLYLVDIGIKSTELKYSDSAKMLNEARLCQVFQSVSY